MANIANAQDGWSLLRALGIPEGLMVKKAVLTIEVDCICTADLTTLLAFDPESEEIQTEVRRFELVEKVEPNGTEAP